MNNVTGIILYGGSGQDFNRQDQGWAEWPDIININGPDEIPPS